MQATQQAAARRKSNHQNMMDRDTYFEIDESVLVSIERTEDVVAKLFGVAVGEKHFVHVDELGWRQAAARAILLQRHINSKGKNSNQHTCYLFIYFKYTHPT